ncbi:hypothetical protein [Longimicrobium sp.]|uniref:hypothetical protein n=1 Tax=Longimicrobium sp. TaxID=2029185 RepID=UPI002E2F3CB0|nr:hypothetical protein [Longimicrobium sp.]HEX6041335.1 hypothetical protein [Longimicrobium sp.]
MSASQAFAARAPYRGSGAALRGHPLLRVSNLSAALSVVLVLLQLRGGTVGEVAALLAVPVSAAAVFAADRRYLPTVLLLALPSLGTLSGRDAHGLVSTATAPFVFPEATTFVALAGVELTAPLAILAAAFARVVLELLRGGRVFRGVLPWWLLPLFLVSFLPVLAGGLQGQALGYNRWSQGPRAMLAVAGFLWGIVVVRRAGPEGVARLTRQLTAVVSLAALLLMVRFLHGMMVFLAVGFIGGVLPGLVARRRFLEAGLCALSVAVAALSMTLTTFAEVVLAIGCVVLAAPGFRAAGRMLVRAGVFAACVMSGLLIWAVMQMQGKTALEMVTRDEGLMAYAVFKLMGDRGPLWLAAVEQITGGPYLVVPAGRPLRPQSFDYGGLVYTWEFGAHNTVLELVRNVGVVGGVAALVLMGFAITAAVRLLLSTPSSALRGLAAGFLGVAIVGITTGNFPVYDVGFFLWAVGGMLAGARLYATREALETAGGAA